MNYIEIVELLCPIISTISIILSSLVLCHRSLSKISVYALIENGCFKLYAVALHRKMVLRDLKIKVKGKIVNDDDIFFNGGQEKIELDVDGFKLIKMIQLAEPLKGLAFITIDTEWDNKVWKIVKIRRR